MSQVIGIDSSTTARKRSWSTPKAASLPLCPVNMDTRLPIPLWSEQRIGTECDETLMKVGKDNLPTA